MKKKHLLQFVGKRVRIEWANPDDDWNYFLVLGVDGKFLHLKGTDTPEGDQHCGNSFWARKDEIFEIYEV